MKALIVENEHRAAYRLKNMINAIDNEIIIDGIFQGVHDTRQYLLTHTSPNLLFLDIHLSDGNAFDLISQIQIDFPIIFTTAYKDYLMQVFEDYSYDYLLKPIRINELEEAINHVKIWSMNLKKKWPVLDCLIENSTHLNAQNNTQRKLKKTAYIQVKGRINIQTSFNGSCRLLNISLDEVYKQLNKKYYCMIPKKIIVHINAITSIEASDDFDKTLLRLTPKTDKEISLNDVELKSLLIWLKDKQYYTAI
jgi:DNA-binding LytR/AlgR family response regulator